MTSVHSIRPLLRASIAGLAAAGACGVTAAPAAAVHRAPCIPGTDNLDRFRDISLAG